MNEFMGFVSVLILSMSRDLLLISACAVLEPAPADTTGSILVSPQPGEAGEGGPAATGAAQPSAQNVELIGQVGGTTHAVAVEGAYAYVGIGARLVILNISDPTQPAVIGQTTLLPGVVQTVTVARDYTGTSSLRKAACTSWM